MLRILFVVILLIGANKLHAQFGDLKGLIVDNEGKPAPFVSIKLKNTQKGTISNTNGEFEIKDLTAQHYILEASFVAFKTLTQKVKIEADKTLTLSLELFENTETLKEIVITGYVSQNNRVTSIGKIDARPMDLPQSIVTIDKTVLENQQVKSMSDVLMNTNGVYIMGTTGGYQEEIAGRGYAFGSSNTFKNGIRYFNGMMLEVGGLEKIEILKGSNAMLFGNVAPGGILNLVTKKPKHEFGGELALKHGSFTQRKVSFDIFGPVSKHAFRINASYEKANSFRVGVSSERIYVNPSLLLKLNPKTELLIEAEYLKDNRTPDFGVGIINYKIVDIPRSQFLGVSWSNFKANQSSVSASISHHINPNWKLNFTTALRKYNTELFANARPNSGSMVAENGNWVRNIQRSEIGDNYFITQLDITGKIKTGQVNHLVLGGSDFEIFNTTTLSYKNFMNYDTVNIFGKQNFKIRTDLPTLSPLTLTSSPIIRYGLYVQDLMHISSRLKVLMGLRYSFQNTKSDVYTYSSNANTISINKDGAFSPRFGLVFQPNTNHAVFASYSNSFALNTGIDVNGNSLAPSIFNQYEMGVKNEFLGGKASLNFAAYIIDNSNLAQTSLINNNTYTYIKELAGSVRSQGVEADFMTRPIIGLYFMAGYSYNKTYYRQSNTYINGSLLRYNPNHTANASVNYRKNGFNIGLTSVYIGQRFAGRSTRIQVNNDVYKIIPLPAFVQLDAHIGYSISKFSIKGKVANLFNVLSYNVHDDNSVNPIAPRNYSISLAYKL